MNYKKEKWTYISTILLTTLITSCHVRKAEDLFGLITQQACSRLQPIIEKDYVDIFVKKG